MERFCYSAAVKNVVDGDTVDLVFDMGLKIYTEVRVRVYGIDTPELHSSDAAIRAKANVAKDFLTTLLNAQAGPVDLRTYKDTKEKYGRYLADIAITKDENGKAFPAPTTCAAYMISKGLGVAYFGGAKQVP